MRQTITGKHSNPTRVQVFEPSQDVTRQSEVILDEFVLGAGESREYDFPTASAAYRFSDAVGPPVRALRDIPDVPPGPEGLSLETQAEMDMGSARVGEAENLQQRRDEHFAHQAEHGAREASGERRRAIADYPKDPDPRDDPNTIPRVRDDPLHPRVRGEGDKLIRTGELTDRPMPPLPAGTLDELRPQGRMLTEGQRPQDALNPSPATGTTGHADRQAELEGGQDGEDQRQAQRVSGEGSGSGEGQLVGEDGSRGEEVEEHDEDTPRKKRRKKED